MASTKNAPPRTETTLPPQEPDPAPPATVERISARKEAWENFSDELEKRAAEIASQLPSNVTRDRFLNAAIAAVKQTPAILNATPRSLFASITKAAQDGLLPDGREGIITVYSQKIPNTSPQRYEDVAQWNPMFFGIRKRARELDDLIIDAQVVVEGDDFDFELGDEPRIKHRPKAQAESMEAKDGVAAYAIFRHPEKGILHREVMWKPEIFKVMNQSRSKTGLMWTVFWTEGWKKTVGRRAAKAVPVSAALAKIIAEDADFAFPKLTPSHPAPALPQPTETTPQLQNSDQQSGAKNEVEDEEPDPAPPNLPRLSFSDEGESADASPLGTGAADEGESFDLTGFLHKIDEAMEQADSEDRIEELWDGDLDVESTLSKNPDGMDLALKIRKRHIERIRNPIDRAALEAEGQGGFSFDDDFPGDR